VTHSPRAFPLGVAAPVGAHQVKVRPRCSPRARRPRLRPCLRKGCNRQYQPRRWNQRYCRDPDCQRQVRRWQAARRQAAHRGDAAARSRHARAEKERRQRAKVAPKAVGNVDLAPARGHAAENFWALPVCDRPGCYEAPVVSPRNPARYCCPACRQALRNVLDRERKWIVRGTLDGRVKRAIEYQAARRRRSRDRCITVADTRTCPARE
jgi:hypothetical protein